MSIGNYQGREVLSLVISWNPSLKESTSFQVHARPFVFIVPSKGDASGLDLSPAEEMVFVLNCRRAWWDSSLMKVCFILGYLKNVLNLFYSLLCWTNLEGSQNEHLLTCACKRGEAELQRRGGIIYQDIGGQAAMYDWNLHWFCCIWDEKSQPAEKEARWEKDAKTFTRSMFQCTRVCLVLLHTTSACTGKQESKTLRFSQLPRKTQR